jgi:Ca2+-binding RTX toxin-like protein
MTLLLILGITLAGLHGPTSVGVPTCGGTTATIVGTAGDDTLIGSDGDDVIVGQGGNDVIRGSDGNDLICGGPGSDRRYSGASGRSPGREEVYGGPGNDRLYAGFVGLANCCSSYEAPVLYGGPGDDVLRSATRECGECDAFLTPGRGDDRIVVEPETNTMVLYGNAPRGIYVDLAAGFARGQGRDRLIGVHVVRGSAHRDVLLGSAGDDYLAGSSGGDTIRGRGGNDLLDGEDGADRLEGGPGPDLLIGGRGRDYCVSGARHQCEEP